MNTRHKNQNTVQTEETRVEDKLKTLYNRFLIKTFKFNDITLSVGQNQQSSNDSRFLISNQNEEFQTSKRFISSLIKAKGLSEQIFRLFTPAEVLQRFLTAEPDYRFKVTIDKNTDTLLALIPENQKLLEADKVLEVISKDKRIKDLNYIEENGQLITDLSYDDEFEIENDSIYQKEFSFNYPLDGYGTPSFNLDLTRQICSNGAKMTVRDYRTDAIISDNDGDHLGRILQSFNNDPGYENLIGRLNKAAVTPCSLDELSKFENYLTRSCQNSKDSHSLISLLEDYAGQPKRKLGVSNLNSIPELRRKTTSCMLNIADLFNVGTELLTHHPSVIAKPALFNTKLAKLVANPFDFEEIEQRKKALRHFYLEGFTEAKVIPEIYTEEDKIEEIYSYDYDASDFLRV